jgi:hypothetical protein
MDIGTRHCERSEAFQSPCEMLWIASLRNDVFSFVFFASWW